jgi:hypothetical protein
MALAAGATRGGRRETMIPHLEQSLGQAFILSGDNKYCRSKISGLTRIKAQQAQWAEAEFALCRAQLSVGKHHGIDNGKAFYFLTAHTYGVDVHIRGVTPGFRSRMERRRLPG